MADATQTTQEVNWKVLEAAANQPWEERPLDERLARLEDDIASERVRVIGTNVVGLELAEEVVEVIESSGTVEYSIATDGSTIDSDAAVFRSYIGDTTIAGGRVTESEVIASELIFSFVSDSALNEVQPCFTSSITGSTIVESGLLGATIIDSTVRDAELASNSRVIKSVVEDVDVSEGTKLFRAGIKDGTHLLDFGKTIGRGNHVYAFRDSIGELVIRAGCKTFVSTREMVEYARFALEYRHLDKKTVGQYLRQIRAVASLINATQARWDTVKKEN